METLDRYTESLTNAITSGKRKSEELKAALETIASRKKEQRTQVRDLEKAEKAAISAKDFATAGAKEQELLVARTALSETELSETQTKNTQSQLAKLLSVADKRKAAIEKNRQILLSGLTVTDLPGLEDLGLLEKSQQSRSGNQGWGL